MDLKWMPEFFYDVIGRIGPGALFLVTALCAWLGPAHAWLEVEGLLETAAGKGWFYFGFASLLSYFVGVVLSALWDSAESLAKPKSRPRSPADEAKSLGDWIEGKSSDAGPGNGFLSCCVKVHLPDQEMRLSKIIAEESFCKALIAGFVLIFILAIVSPSTWSLADFSLASSYLIGAMVLSIVACWNWMGFLRDVYNRDLLSLGYLVASSRMALAVNKPERDGGEIEPSVTILEVRP